MKQAIEAVRDLFTSAALGGTDAAEAAAYALAEINWSSDIQLEEPCSPPVVDEYLETLCMSAGQYGSNAHMIGEAILRVKDKFRWHLWGNGGPEDPDIEVFRNRFAHCSLIGCEAPLRSDKIKIGFTLQAPDIYYPPHAHQAVVTYWILSGDGNWRVGSDPWFPVESGSLIHHETGARHAMQTNHSAMLTVWLWTSHLDSPVVIVRG